MPDNRKRVDRMRLFASEVVRYMGEQHPDPLLDDLQKAVGGAQTERQLRELVNDLLEWTVDLRGAALEHLDDRLGHEGLPTLSLMREKQKRVFASVLVQGRISTDEEYRLLSGQLADVDAPISEHDRSLAGELMGRYEKERAV